MESPLRCFVACSIGEGVRGNARGVLGELAGTGADFRWVKPESLHVTLKFLGDVAENRIESLCAALREACCTVEPFSVEFRGIGAFPGIRNPQVVWAGVTEGARELASLAEKVEEALASLSFPREARPFRPHLTLGRRRSARGIVELCNLMMTLRDRPLGRNDVCEAFLMRSILKPEGALYQRLSSFPLGLSNSS